MGYTDRENKKAWKARRTPEPKCIKGTWFEKLPKLQGLESFSKSRVSVKKNRMFFCHSKLEYKATDIFSTALNKLLYLVL